MAGLGFKEFAVSEVLTASDLNGYCQAQSVMVFESTTARDAAITSPASGMTCWTTTTPASTLWRYYTEYDGTSAWWQIESPWRDFTPTWSNMSIGNGTNEFRYRYRNGDYCIIGTMQFGSTSTMGSGFPRFVMPDSYTFLNNGALASNGMEVTGIAGTGAVLVDASGSSWRGGITGDGANMGFTYASNGSTGGLSLDSTITSTTPFTWTTSDRIVVNCTFPAPSGIDYS